MVFDEAHTDVFESRTADEDVADDGLREAAACNMRDRYWLYAVFDCA